MALVILLRVRLGRGGGGGERLHQPHCAPPGQPHSGGSAQTPLFQPLPPPSIPSLTSLCVSPESGDTANSPGLDGLSDTELDCESPPFSFSWGGGGAGSKREQGSSSPEVWERPLEL